MWWAPASQITDPENIYSRKSMPGAWLSPADPEVKCPTPASRCFALLWRESRLSMARGKSGVQPVEQSFERHLPLTGWLLRDNQERLKVGDRTLDDLSKDSSVNAVKSSWREWPGPGVRWKNLSSEHFTKRIQNCLQGIWFCFSRQGFSV